jgi:heme-degrading monooxygenase HmoA
MAGRSEGCSSLLRIRSRNRNKRLSIHSGNISAKILRKIDGDICHFYTITEWNDIESIINFAGNDYEKARYYPEDKEYLLEFEETVVLAS